jgi:hypothetical protein
VVQCLAWLGYFRKYIRGFAAVVTPLTKLLKGLSTHEKEGRLLLCGRLPPTEEALQRAFVSLWIEAAVTRQTSAYLFTSLSFPLFCQFRNAKNK